MTRSKINDRANLTELQSHLFDAAAGGVRAADLQRWASNSVIFKADDDDGESYPRGIAYDNDTNTIRLSGVISDDLTAHWMNYIGMASPGMLRNAIRKAKDGWTLEINSPGGNVDAAAEMVSIVGVNKPSITVVTGMAASAAAIIFLAGKDRYAGSELSMLMYHAAWIICIGNATDMQAMADSLRKVEDAFGDFIKKRVPKKAADTIIDACAAGNDLYITASEAQELGLLNGIVEDAQAAEPDEPMEDDPDEEDEKMAAERHKTQMAHLRDTLKSLSTEEV